MTTNKKTVWIVEDDIFISEAMQIILEEHGYLVKLFKNYKDIELALAKAPPDVILMDIWLGSEDGIEITQKIKEFINIPIILISANIISYKQLRDSQANDFLKKPFELTDLISIVKKYSQ